MFFVQILKNIFATIGFIALLVIIWLIFKIDIFSNIDILITSSDNLSSNSNDRIVMSANDLYGNIVDFYSYLLSAIGVLIAVVAFAGFFNLRSHFNFLITDTIDTKLPKYIEDNTYKVIKIITNNALFSEEVKDLIDDRIDKRLNDQDLKLLDDKNEIRDSNGSH